jgi:hypothetical protein
MNDSTKPSDNEITSVQAARILSRRMASGLWRFTRNHGWAGVLGGTLGIVGISVASWQYWTVFIPVMIFVNLRPYVTKPTGAAQQ